MQRNLLENVLKCSSFYLCYFFAWVDLIDVYVPEYRLPTHDTQIIRFYDSIAPAHILCACENFTLISTLFLSFCLRGISVNLLSAVETMSFTTSFFSSECWNQDDRRKSEKHKLTFVFFIIRFDYLLPFKRHIVQTFAAKEMHTHTQSGDVCRLLHIFRNPPNPFRLPYMRRNLSM